MSAGSLHTIAIDANKLTYGWGNNFDGQISVSSSNLDNINNFLKQNKQGPNYIFKNNVSSDHTTIE